MKDLDQKVLEKNKIWHFPLPDVNDYAPSAMKAIQYYTSVNHKETKAYNQPILLILPQ
jgi:hypothetical protein